MNIDELQNKAVDIRKELLTMIYEAGGGHVGGSLSSVDILIALHYGVMRLDPRNPKWEQRDRFILSKGHSVEGYYAILCDIGFFSKDELKTYRKFGSKLIGHPSNKVPGVEASTGALGHGLSIGVGMALAGKMDAKDYKVYVLMGDGEQAEGSLWEAAMAAGNYKLDNLIGIIDRNGLQISGSTEDVMKLESLKDKWASFGWHVQSLDGHDITGLIRAFQSMPLQKGKPHLIMANTIKGKGVPFMENDAAWHHKVPDSQQLNMALQALDAQYKEVR
jgi:transketolase